MNHAMRLLEKSFREIRVAVPDVFAHATVALAPRSMDETVSIMRVAAAEGLRVVPFGSGSTLRTPETDIVLVTRNLAGFIEHQPDDLTIVVGAGTTLSELNTILEPHRQSAILPEVSPDRTVGGVVASGASGYSRLRYGPTRDRVLEVVMATGYGEVVRAGGRLVKNVTGYDLSRLATGSYGSLGVIGSVCLKLWPRPLVRRTIAVTDIARSFEVLYQPVAVLETEKGMNAFVQGSEASVDADVRALGGSVTEGFAWPEPGVSDVLVGVRVPSRLVSEALVVIKSMSPNRFVAQHGVGVIETGFDTYHEADLENLRTWAQDVGGSITVAAAGLSAEQRWGRTHGAVRVQRRLLDLFDPAGVCNPGTLSGTF